MSKTSRRRTRLAQPIASVLLAVVALAVPFWMVILTASKTTNEARSPNLSLPSHWALLENLGTALTEGHVAAAFGGSIVVLIPAIFGVLLFGSMASWVLARRKGRLVSVAYAIGISGVVVPPAVVTVVLLLRQLGLAGTAVGLVGVYIGMYLGTAIFFITGFIRTIPIELEEAARVDGASPIRVFFRVILPLLSPVIATATILISLFIWNDVFYALFVVGGRLDTLPLNLFSVANSGLYLQNWNLIFAYIILMTLPFLLVFVVAQRRIISGVTSGAVK